MYIRIWVTTQALLYQPIMMEMKLLHQLRLRFMLNTVFGLKTLALMRH